MKKLLILLLVLLGVIMLIIGCTSPPTVKPDGSDTLPVIPVTEPEPEPIVEVEEPAVEEEVKTKMHEIKVTDNGFEPLNLNIKSGDKVVWKNERTGRYTKTQIIGTRNCLEVKSKIFSAGEEFSWVFKEPRTCIMIDGITQTDNGKIIVEAEMMDESK